MFQPDISNCGHLKHVPRRLSSTSVLDIFNRGSNRGSNRGKESPMKRSSHLTLLIGCTAGVLLTLMFGACKPGYSAETSTSGDTMTPVYSFTLNNIDGNLLPLQHLYEGKFYYSSIPPVCAATRLNTRDCKRCMNSIGSKAWRSWHFRPIISGNRNPARIRKSNPFVTPNTLWRFPYSAKSVSRDRICIPSITT